MTAISDPQTHRNRRITIITINYHCSELVAELIESTLAFGDPEIRFLVVDNSPKDPGLDHLARRSCVTVLRAATNLGFGAGCNLGLDHIQGEDPGAIVWLLNPDARLLPGAIASVRQVLQATPRPAVLGTRIRDLEGHIWFDRGSFDPWFGRLTHRPVPDRSGSRSAGAHPLGASTPRLTDTASSQLIEPSDWLSGCSLIFDLEVLPAVPRFDPQLFLDYEDAEICLRLARQGYPAHVTRSVLVEHAVSAVTARVPRAKYRHATFSKLYLLDHHATALALALNLLYFGLRPLLMLPRNRAQALGRWAGLADYLRWRARSWRGDHQVRHPRTRFTVPS
ncbi:MAG: glycosyltransferase family 2 protein [Synechococcaceae cyanobacterium]|nr:glycosyltransferase family 2 protein [Synechococcaceae cyanobacterium]